MTDIVIRDLKRKFTPKATPISDGLPVCLKCYEQDAITLGLFVCSGCNKNICGIHTLGCYGFEDPDWRGVAEVVADFVSRNKVPEKIPTGVYSCFSCFERTCKKIKTE